MIGRMPPNRPNLGVFFQPRDSPFFFLFSIYSSDNRCLFKFACLGSVATPLMPGFLSPGDFPLRLSIPHFVVLRRMSDRLKSYAIHHCDVDSLLLALDPESFPFRFSPAGKGCGPCQPSLRVFVFHSDLLVENVLFWSSTRC